MVHPLILSFPLGLLLSLAATAGASERPTRGAIQRTIAQAEPTLVQVVGKKHKALGVMVSSQGHVVTAADLVGLETAAITDGEGTEQRRPVVFSDARLGLALVQLTAAGQSGPTAAAVRTKGPQPREWLIALSRSKKGVLQSKLTQVLSGRGMHRILDMVLPPGTPLYDARGQLVAMTISRGRAVPVSALRRAMGLRARGTPPR